MTYYKVTYVDQRDNGWFRDCYDLHEAYQYYNRLVSDGNMKSVQLSKCEVTETILKRSNHDTVINIHNITVNTPNATDFIEQLKKLADLHPRTGQ